MNLISSIDTSKEQIEKIFEIADNLSEGREEAALKEGSILALFFQKPSTRTRVSFEAAISQLGGTGIYIDAATSQFSRGETPSDTARILSSYCDFIAARLNSHADMNAFAEGSSVPVINALTDLEHPTQALADMYTVRAHKKNLRDARIAFLGDIATNTANSLMVTAAKLGAEMELIGPKGYNPESVYFNKAREYGNVRVYDSMEEGLEGANFIYTDTFVSMGQEKSADERRKLFAPYQLNAKALGLATPDVLVMHCLPAHRNEEITSDVLDGPRSIVWEQAKNKLLIAKAVLIYLSL